MYYVDRKRRAFLHEKLWFWMKIQIVNEVDVWQQDETFKQKVFLYHEVLTDSRTNVDTNPPRISLFWFQIFHCFCSCTREESESQLYLTYIWCSFIIYHSRIKYNSFGNFSKRIIGSKFQGKMYMARFQIPWIHAPEELFHRGIVITYSISLSNIRHSRIFIALKRSYLATALASSGMSTGFCTSSANLNTKSYTYS